MAARPREEMMRLRKVRVGSPYIYDPVLWDVIDSKTSLKRGEKVRVIKSPIGAPPCGTMGHCYVGDPVTRKFIGLVHVNSLTPEREYVAA
jgi:hypothetical protein